MTLSDKLKIQTLANKMFNHPAFEERFKAKQELWELLDGCAAIIYKDNQKIAIILETFCDSLSRKTITIRTFNFIDTTDTKNS